MLFAADFIGDGIGGYTAAAVLVGVLVWVFYKHLPAKDEQMKDFQANKTKELQAKDEQIMTAFESKDKTVTAIAEAHTKTSQAILDHCKEGRKEDRDALDREREASQRRHDQLLLVLQEILGSSKDNTHAFKDLANELSLRKQAAQPRSRAMYTLALDGTVLSWNRQAEELLGWEWKDMVSESFFKMVPPARRKEEEAILVKLIAGDTPDEYTTERFDKQLRTVTLKITPSPQKDQAGKVVGAQIFMTRPHG